MFNQPAWLPCQPQRETWDRTSTSEPWPTYCMSTNSVGQWWMRRITHITPRGEEDGTGRVRRLSHRFAFFPFCWETDLHACRAEEAFCPSQVSELGVKCQKAPRKRRGMLHIPFLHLYGASGCFYSRAKWAASVKEPKWKNADFGRRSTTSSFPEVNETWSEYVLSLD